MTDISAPIPVEEENRAEPADLRDGVPEAVTADDDPGRMPGEDREAEAFWASMEEDAETESGPDRPDACPEQEKADRMSRDQFLRARDERNRERTARTQERNAFLIGWNALKSARAGGTVLRAPVASVETLQTAQGRREVFLVTMINSRYKILIPFHEIYQEDPLEDADPAGLTDRQRQMASKLLNSNIDFCITGLFPGKRSDFGDYLCSGSRRRALSIITRRNYLARKEGAEPALKAGSRTEATVVTVGPHALRANVGGVDTQIPIRNLTFRYVSDLRDMYLPGDRIRVEILEVQISPDERVRVSVTARSLEVEESKKRLHLLGGRGTRVMATVTGVRYTKERKEEPAAFGQLRQEEDTSFDRGGRTVLYAHIPSPLDLSARVYGMNTSGLFRSLLPGDLIRVSVLGVGEDGVVNCAFNAMLGSPGALLH